MSKKINTWEELSRIESPTHVLDIDLDWCCGYIYSKTDKDFFSYLSTHTFYGGQHEESTAVLQNCGFDVEIANWDE